MIFTVNGKPTGKGRARTVRNKYTGKVHSFTPEKTASYEELIRWSYKSAGGEYYADKMLEISIIAFFPIPQSYSKKKNAEANCGDIRPTKKPDCDNIIKIVLDALNGVAYHDDKQVVCVSCNKYYAETGCVVIKINELKTKGEEHNA